MRRIKYILFFLGGLVVLCLVFIAIVLLTFDNEDYRRLVTQGVKYFAGYSMTIEGPFAIELSKEPSLSAEAIRIDAGADGAPPPVTTIGKLRIQIALRPLLRGMLVVRELLVEDVVMAVDIEAETEDDPGSARKVPPDIEIPVLESVRLRNIQLDMIDKAADRTIKIRLRQFAIDDIRDSGPLFVKGEGSVSGNEFKIDGQLGALAAMLKGAQPYPLALNLSSAGFALSVSGTVEDFMDGEGLQLHLSAEASELSNLFKLLQMQVPPLGDLKLEATVTHDLSAPEVSDLNLRLSGDHQVEFAVKGSIANAINGEGANIQFSGSCANPDIFKLMLPKDLPGLNRVRIAGEVREADGAIGVENLKVEADAAQGLSVSAGGRFGLGENISEPVVNGMAVNIELSLASTEFLKPYVIDSLPEIGPLTAQARLSGSLEHLSLEEIVVDADESGPLRLTSQGRIGRLPGSADMTVSEIDLTASLQAKNTHLLASGFGIEVPELGSVSLRTRIRGSSDRFQLAEIDARTSHAKGLKVALSGSIDFEQHKKSALLGNLNIQAQIAAPSMSAGFAPLSVSALPDLKPLRISAQIGGTTEVLSLKKIALSIGRSGPMRMEVKGDVGRIPLADNRPISEVKLAAFFQAKNTSVLSTFLGVSTPDLGPLKATGRITDRKGTIGVRNVNLSVGDDKNTKVKVTGAISSVLKAYEMSVDGIDLLVETRDLGLQSFSDLIGQPLPEVGPLNGSFRLAGSLAQMAISKVKLATVSPRGFKLTVSGGVDRVRLDGENPLEGVDVSFTATAPNSAAVAALADFELPDLGPVQMKASVNDGGGSLDVKSFDIRSGSDKAALFHMQGQILRITDLKQMALQAAFETASHPWVAKYMQQPEADNFPLTGEIKLSGAADGLIIDGVRFGTADGKRLNLEAQGWLTNLSASLGIDLKLTASAPDPSALGSMMGVSLPPLNSLSIIGRLNGNAQKVFFEGETHIGETTFRSKVNGAFTAQRPRIDARFAATSVNLDNMGIYPEAPKEDSVQTLEPKSANGGRLFDDAPLSFEAFKAVDLYLALDADKLIGRNVTVEKVDLDILLENGRLQIRPASMVYAAGFTSAEFVIDVSGSTPEFTLKVTGEDIDVDDMLAYAHEPVILSGALNLVTELHSSGRSPSEIASNLKGEFSVALENGRIRRIIDFLSLDAFDAVLTTADRRKYTDLRCMVNKIQFQDGLGTIEIFYMDTPKIRTRGAGNVNLAEETIDLVVHPEKKRKLLFKKGSAIRIKGSLAKPSVKTLPISEAAMLFGDIFMPYVTIPARALGYLWSLIKNDKEATPCVFDKR